MQYFLMMQFEIFTQGTAESERPMRKYLIAKSLGRVLVFVALSGMHIVDARNIPAAGVVQEAAGKQAVKRGNTINVSDFGSVGSVDDTAVVQMALNAAPNKTLYFGAGIYTVNPISVRSNSHIIFDENALLSAKKGYGINDRLLMIVNVNNVLIEANNAQVKMLKNEYVRGEQRHGVAILSSSDVTINDLRSSDSGGDGFYIGSEDNISPSKNIILNNCRSYNNRRQGLSIVSVRNLWVNGGEYSNTSGTSPEFGIDIEPNSSSDWLENVNLKGVRTRGNAKGGIQFALAMYGATASKPVSVNIVDWHSISDGKAGALRFAYAPSFSLIGVVKIKNATIESPAGRGVDFISLNEHMPKILIDNLTVVNPGSSIATPGNVDLSAVSLYSGPKKTFGEAGNISFENCLFIDTRTVVKMYSGVYVAGENGVNNIFFRNVKIKNYTAREYTILGRDKNIMLESDGR